MKTKSTLPLLIAIASAGLFSCSPGNSEKGTAAETTTETTSGTAAQETPANDAGETNPTETSPTKTGTVDACQLVTEADARQALGEPVRHVNPEREPAWPQCDYVPVDEAHRLAARLVQIQAGIKGGRSQFNFNRKMFVDSKDVTGLGDAAYYSDPAGRTELNVIKGDHYFMVAVGLGEANKEAAQLEAAKKLAATVLQRL